MADLLESAHSFLSQVCSPPYTFSDSSLATLMSLVDQTLEKCNEMDTEIVNIHDSLGQSYGKQFPELGSMVQHPVEYSRVVKRIGFETDLNPIDFQGILPSHVVLIVSIAASSTGGNPLPRGDVEKVIDGCDQVIALDGVKRMLVEFLESRSEFVAPNLSAVEGSAIAAKIIGAAGGLSEMARMPGCNFQLIGFEKKDLAGFLTATCVGYVRESDIVKMTPAPLAMHACQLVAEKSALAARVDAARGHPTGEYGRNLKLEILKKIAKWQEPPPAKWIKPLPVPDLKQKKKRYTITDMRKLANRMQFGAPEESSIGDGLGVGYGMLGKAGNGKLRVSAAQSNLAAKVAKKYLAW